MSGRILLGVCFVLILGLAGCCTIPDRKWAVPESEQPAYPISGPGIRIIQIDEGAPKGEPLRHGKFFEDTDLGAIGRWLEAGRNAPIVVYIHGWHHNATDRKENLPKFRAFIKQLDDDICEVAKQRGSSGACTPVQGLFVGWRGDSLDPWLLPDILDVATFGSRKRASVRVGTGDLQKVLQLVSGFKDRDVFIAGHSLGANALYHALREQGKFKVADRHEYFLLNPATTSAEFDEVFEELSRRAERDDQLANLTTLRAAQLRILRREHRKVMVIQANKDWVVGSLFASAYGLPIGFDKERRTHAAEAAPIAACPALNDRSVTDYCNFTLDSGLTIRPYSSYAEHCEVAFGKATWIVEADRTLSSSHGDIWDSEQRCALGELIAKRVNRVPGF